ncbi:iron ABC transporter permease [Micrococcus luteus]|uniref:FecCD family ABC transporter permease n=1 Tax=Micrococcus luteus TaxID=1270 RepID=UPI0021059FC3|nr:iron ABC transporter permease [Micrococcus luteus]MCV7513797.1 iron ABC transporter permease [Micrococcus luteus]UTX34803.1 iron ABC transporter permease [Micrococcus luteus]
MTAAPLVDSAPARVAAHPTAADPARSAAVAVTAHRARARHRAVRVTGLVVLTVAAFVVSMLVGPIDLGLGEIVQVALGGADAQARTVVLDLRLPPAVLAVVVGAALSLAGLQMQTILDNPLAEPFTLGLSAAAACGAAVVIVTGLVLPWAPEATLAVAACGMALAASGVIILAARSRRAGRESMVLLGIALVFGFQAVLALMQYSASSETLQQIVFWSLGSLVRAGWTSIAIITVCLVVIGALFWVNGWKLTALRLGEARASAMGIRVARLRVWSLVGISVLAAVSVSAVGVIGFAGLVGPHVARILVGEDQRYLLPASLASGALLLSAAHAVSQVVFPGVVVPVGIITAIIGVPFFVVLVLGRRRMAGATR